MTRERTGPHAGRPYQGGGARLWLLIALVALGGLAAYWYWQPRAQPDWLKGYLPRAQPAEVTLYRWRGPQGELNITQEPPSDRPYRTVTYPADVNVVDLPRGEDRGRRLTPAGSRSGTARLECPALRHRRCTHPSDR